MTCQLPERRLFPFVGAYMAPRLRDEYLKISDRFHLILSSRGIGPIYSYYESEYPPVPVPHHTKKHPTPSFLQDPLTTGYPLTPGPRPPDQEGRPPPGSDPRVIDIKCTRGQGLVGVGVCVGGGGGGEYLQVLGLLFYIPEVFHCYGQYFGYVVQINRRTN